MLGIYIRKSREHKKEKSIKEQKLLGQEFALENKFEYQFYDEGIISGQKTKEQRPKFAELLKDIEDGRIKGVFIWDSSRLARNEIAWHTFADLLKKTGTILYDNGVSTDFRDENTYLFYTIKAGMDAHFARLTAKKIKTVLKRNAMEGIPHGITPYGYTRDSNGKWKIHEDEVQAVETIFDLYQKGYGYIRIANHLNEMGVPTRYEIIWTPATIRYMIYNTTYSGRAKHNDLEIEVPQIIDKEKHDMILDSISTRYKKPGAKSKKYILNEVMVCGKCGTRYTISQRHRHSYYRCLSEVNRGVPKCHSKAVSAIPIDKLIFEKILLGQELYEQAKKTYQAGGNTEQKKVLEKKRGYYIKKQEKLKKEAKRNHELYVKEVVEMESFMEVKTRIDKQAFKTDESLKEIETELQQLENTNRVLVELENDFKFNLFEQLIDLSDPHKKEYFDKSMKQIVQNTVLEENKRAIIENTPFEEKVAMVTKYIKRITVDFPEVPLRIKIEFNIPIPPMELIMESRYYGALDLNSEKEYFLRDFGKQPLKIYHRMRTEFSQYSNVETFDYQFIKNPLGFLKHQ